MTERDDQADLRTLVQEAVDAAATTYADDATADVARVLRARLRERGVDIDDDEWLTEAAHHIRSGHPVVVGTGSPQDEATPPS